MLMFRTSTGSFINLDLIVLVSRPSLDELYLYDSGDKTRAIQIQDKTDVADLLRIFGQSDKDLREEFSITLGGKRVKER